MKRTLHRTCLLQIVVMAFFIVLTFVPTYASGQLFFLDNPSVGKPAHDFTLKTLSGKEKSLTAYREGKSAIIFFWATWCPHCRAALKNLSQNHAKFEKEGVTLALVDLGESPNEVRSYIEKNKINWDVFLDENSSLAEPYGIVGVPTFVFVNKDGVIKGIENSLPDNYLEILAKK